MNNNSLGIKLTKEMKETNKVLEQNLRDSSNAFHKMIEVSIIILNLGKICGN